MYRIAVVLVRCTGKEVFLLDTYLSLTVNNALLYTQTYSSSKIWF